jgi:hypothetical protein
MAWDWSSSYKAWEGWQARNLARVAHAVFYFGRIGDPQCCACSRSENVKLQDPDAPPPSHSHTHDHDSASACGECNSNVGKQHPTGCSHDHSAVCGSNSVTAPALHVLP